jgi:hypothetical protein
MTLPDDLPPAGDRYYVALSLFDGAESYDQVGFADVNGSWQIFYASAPACGTEPSLHWGGFSLARATNYTFGISVDGGGVILFLAREGTGPTNWTETVHTGATYLDVEATQTCGTSVVPGLTETEVVYTASLRTPPYNFVLTDATVGANAESDWATLAGSNSTTVVNHTGADVTIDNEPFSVRFSSLPDTVTIETTPSPQVVHTNVFVQIDSIGTTVGLSASTSAPGWEFTANPASSNASFAAVLSVDIPPAIPLGTYVVEIAASSASGLSNRIALVVTALPGLTLSVASSPMSGVFDANETARLLPSASGGRPGYSFSWTTLAPGCSAVATGNATCEFVDPGDYSLVAGVADTLNYATFRSVSLVAEPDPTLSTSAGTVSVGVGVVLTLTVGLTGGIAPYEFFWQGLPPGCVSANSTSLSCTPSSVGVFPVAVIVTDHTGFRSSLVIAVTVASPVSSGPVSLGELGLVLIAGGMVVLIATCIVLLVRRRR